MRLEFNEVRMSFSGGAEQAHRAERISRLAFEYLSEMWAAGGGGRGSADAEIGRLEIEPVRLALDSTGDEAAARAAAAEIYRALLGALNS